MRALDSFIIALSVFAFSTAGCRKPTPKEEPAPVADITPAPAAWNVGDKVDVKWNGSFWKAEITAVKTPNFRVHYTGWSASWDEDVTPDRIRAPGGDSQTGTEVAVAAPGIPAVATPTPVTAAGSTFKVGDKVDVQWNGQWWAAQVLAVDGGQFKVHYIGWSASWDEKVAASRVRRPTAGAKKGSGPA